MKSEFMKFDSDKIRVELMEPEFILGVGKIVTFGAKKYEANNWKKGSSEEDIQRYLGAAMRHLLAYMNGEKNDPESGESHLYHLSCNAMFLDYFDRRNDIVEVPLDDIENATEGSHEDFMDSLQFFADALTKSSTALNISDMIAPTEPNGWIPSEKDVVTAIAECVMTNSSASCLTVGKDYNVVNYGGLIYIYDDDGERHTFDADGDQSWSNYFMIKES